MKKLVLALVLALCLAMGGCQSSGSPFKPPETDGGMIRVSITREEGYQISGSSIQSNFIAQGYSISQDSQTITLSCSCYSIEIKNVSVMLLADSIQVRLLPDAKYFISFSSVAGKRVVTVDNR